MDMKRAKNGTEVRDHSEPIEKKKNQRLLKG
jgi:hypothetical protein